MHLGSGKHLAEAAGGGSRQLQWTDSRPVPLAAACELWPMPSHSW